MITFSVVPAPCDGCRLQGDVMRYRFAPASQPSRVEVHLCPTCLEDFLVGIEESIRHFRRVRPRAARA